MAKSGFRGKPYPKFSVNKEFDLLHKEALEEEESFIGCDDGYDDEPDDDPELDRKAFEADRKLTPEEADDLIRHMAPDDWDD